MLRHTRGFLRLITIVFTLCWLLLSDLASWTQLPSLRPLQSMPAYAAPRDDTQLFKPVQLAADSPELVNPMRGLYRWLNNETVPSPHPLPRRSFDAYDRYEWRDMEKERGQYDFSVLERDIKKAAAAGQRYAFRVRTMVIGKGKGVPDYLIQDMALGWWADTNKDGKGDTYVPDWNDQDFLDGVERLLLALGERYSGDPRVSFIDIGIFGSWGEWHTSGISYNSSNPAKTMTRENRQQLIDIHLAAFPETPLVMMTDDERSLIYALERSPRIGWRRDSLGDSHFDDILHELERIGADKVALFSERWKTAPVITEFINPRFHRNPDTYLLAAEQVKRYHISMVGNGNTISWGDLSDRGRAALVDMAKASGYRFAPSDIRTPLVFLNGNTLELTSNWVNSGVAPAYEEWQLWYQLRDEAGAVVWEAASQLDLRKLLPNDATTALQVQDTFTLPKDVAAGRYSLTLSVRHNQNVRQPLSLAIDGRLDDGGYLIGQVDVANGRQNGVALEQQVYLPQVYR